jgi:phage tail sheath gpL-like
MSGITASTLAAAKGSSITNQQFQFSASALPRKILIIGTADPSKELSVDLDTPIAVTSPSDVGSKTGFGWMLYRLAVQSFKGSKNAIPTYIMMQAEDDGGVKASGEIDFVGSTGVLAGTLSIYISGILDLPVNVTITDAMTPDEIATAVADAINAITELPVTATALTTVVTITSKSVGAWGNDISITVNLLASDVIPTGIVLAITDMASGASSDDIQTALDALGTGDGANEDHYTDIIQGYGHVTANLNSISTYVGPGNAKVGLYGELVHRPFRVLSGDVDPGSAGLTAVRALGDGRTLDRANGIISVPGSPGHPQEIAAQTMGIMAGISHELPEQSYADFPLSGVHPGSKASTSRWTSELDNRDAAVKSGVSPTFVRNNIVYLQNIVTFYHPPEVPVESNGYRSMRNIALGQNLLHSQASAFATEKWQGTTLVSDIALVNPNSKKKARDVSSVISQDVTLINSWASLAWIYETAFSIKALQDDPPTVRVGADGFVNKIKVILSGEGLILDTETEFDVSIAVL